MAEKRRLPSKCSVIAPKDDTEGPMRGNLLVRNEVDAARPAPEPRLAARRRVAFVQEAQHAQLLSPDEGQDERGLWDQSVFDAFLPLATSTPRRRRAPDIDYNVLANDPSMDIDQTWLCGSDDESENECHPDVAADDIALDIEAAMVSPVPAPLRRGQPTGKRKTANSRLVPTAVVAVAPVATHPAAPILTYKKFTNGGKASVRVEDEVDKDTINTFDKLLAECRRCLAFKEGEIIPDLSIKIGKGGSSQKLLTTDDFASLLAAITARERKSKDHSLTKLWLSSESAEARAKAAPRQTARVAAALKDAPPNILSGGEEERVVLIQLSERHKGSCAQCGPEVFCLRGSVTPHHRYVWLQFGVWAKALVEKRAGVSIAEPPKVTAFASYWGPHVQLEDGENPEVRIAQRKSTEPRAAIDPTTFLALVPAIVEAARRASDTQSGADSSIEDKKLIGFILDHEHLFPEVIDFLQTMTRAEEGRPNGHDWIQYADALTRIGCSHLGRLFIFTMKNQVALEERIHMPFGLTDYFALKVRAECSKIMNNAK
ncbi:hypothetical protein BKA62DRAFT_767774 [Auriculariales sp. MPI-PUGE-AT-0066]|nr:hypothetical protein BKA62DRAFT_767774 [Auriculariales sp. MPI-PUGE-AT-0066]